MERRQSLNSKGTGKLTDAPTHTHAPTHAFAQDTNTRALREGQAERGTLAVPEAVPPARATPGEMDAELFCPGPRERGRPETVGGGGRGLSHQAVPASRPLACR